MSDLQESFYRILLCAICSVGCVLGWYQFRRGLRDGVRKREIVADNNPAGPVPLSGRQARDWGIVLMVNGVAINAIALFLSGVAMLPPGVRLISAAAGKIATIVAFDSWLLNRSVVAIISGYRDGLVRRRVETASGDARVVVGDEAHQLGMKQIAGGSLGICAWFAIMVLLLPVRDGSTP